MSNFTWIIFDFGGTLVTKLDRTQPDPEDFSGAIVFDFITSKGHRLEQDESEAKLRMEKAGIEANARNHEKGLFTNQRDRENNLRYLSAWAKHVTASVGLELSDTQCREAAFYYCNEYARRQSELTDIRDVDEFLGELKSLYRLGVLSNNSGFVENNLVHLGIDHHFEFIIDSANTGYVKPEAEIFTLTLERAQAEACECLYVGDDFTNDVIGSKGVGMSAAYINLKGADLPAGVEPDYHVSRLLELKEHLIPSVAKA